MAQQQRVEILKALYRGAEILVLDEPTAVLTPQEAKELFAILDELRAQGKSIIFISHKLHEVLEVADRITVLRRGQDDRDRSEGGCDRGEPRPGDGRPGSAAPRGEDRPRRRVSRCSVSMDLHVFDDRGLEKVRGVSLRRASRRDRRHRRRRRQRPDRADRRAHRAHAVRRGQDQRRGQGDRPCLDVPRDARPRHRAHSRGPPAARPRARVLDRGEHRAARLQHASRTRSSAGSTRAAWSNGQGG